MVATLVDEAILREWLLNNGQRDAEERIAHLICELHARLDVVGLVTGDRFSLPAGSASSDRGAGRRLTSLR